MSSEQDKLLAMAQGLHDQIRKQHWLNVHFRAFELANDAWSLHVRTNAKIGAKAVNSPPGAVLDDNREETD